jgi:hypothetical protein
VTIYYAASSAFTAASRFAGARWAVPQLEPFVRPLVRPLALAAPHSALPAP